MKYRAEIDGLRALAVIPVILYHAGIKLFGGGFVGVDVFFVISGYLITTIILAELENGSFSLLHFYERRVRRILPALFLVMFACLPFAWFWLLPNALKAFSQSLVAVNIFTSNFLFWHTSGYFDSTSELKPLIHTWSLAVEEQYYALFPLLIMATWKLGRRRILWILSAIFLISLVSAQLGVTSKPTFTFFMLPTRVWELLIGAFIAFYHTQKNINNQNPNVAQIGGLIGLLLITYPVFAYSNQTPFPGLYALAPTIGAALIIIFATPKTVIGSLLSSKICVTAGLVSYSAYLWHQPMFAFARERSLEEPSAYLMLTLAILSFGFAYLSWKYVEKPFRNTHRINRNKVFIYATVCSACFVSIGLAGIATDGFKLRLPPNLLYQSFGEKLQRTGDICNPLPVDAYKGVLACEFGSVLSKKSILLYGDSHMQAISEEFEKALISKNIKGLKVALEGCEVVPQIYNTFDRLSHSRKCEDSFNNLLAYIKNIKSDIVIASRWTMKLYPIENEISDMPSKNSEGGIERDLPYREYAIMNKNGKFDGDGMIKKRALGYFLNSLLSTEVNVYLVYPIPEISWDIAKVNFLYYTQNSIVLPSISIPYSDFKNRNKFVYKVFSAYEERSNFIPIKPEYIFCNSFLMDRCVAQYNTIPFYYDDDHLSNIGAELVVHEILRGKNW
jgi:peptidoglycan/LPS O-acetylase OafA/YrhL